ncbi:hypothetical protein ZWY2020_054166 [Hordeum vulgare]|nr:hypothetical protein ZWY2020_054166 [Hordeum vulgare]
MFQSFIGEKVVPLAGDMIYKDFGIDVETLRELQLIQELEVIVNSAATTNFNEMYDVALNVNVMGVKHLCHFVKKCPNLEVLLHVSTAYVGGDKQGLVQERPFIYGETLRDGTHLDIDAELRLANDLRKQMDASMDPTSALLGPANTYVFIKSMGEMILSQLLQDERDVPIVIIRPSIITSILNDPLPGWIEGDRSIHTVVLSYVKENQTCFLADLGLTMDVVSNHNFHVIERDDGCHGGAQLVLIRGDKVLYPSTPVVYHVSSSLRHPASRGLLYEAGFRYLKEHPLAVPNGQAVRTHKMWFIGSIFSFRLFMVLRYLLSIEFLHLLSILCCGFFGLDKLYQKLAHKYRSAMQIVDLYGSYALFKGCFEDINLNKLRLALPNDHGSLFNFDPKTIDWNDYFYRVHIPGVIKYMLN